ncbi:MAG: hypothetical protein HN390_04270 [Anaerolineae bacterium]|nr:hypothetical protein [Anaerolineae bacterium]MBT7189472.1 hypothetical protein [Anaerolineae bacterium]
MKEKIISIVVVALAFSLLVGILFRVNYLITPEFSGGDSFRVPWMGARTFLFTENNPYLAETAEETQIAIYGQPAEEGQYPYRLDTPFYLLIFYFPFALIKDFDQARALWMSLAEISLFAVGFLSIYLAEWKSSRVSLVLFFSTLFLSFYGLYPLFEGSGTIFTALILLLALVALREKWEEVLGILLLFSTFHLQKGALLLFFILFLIIAARRWRVFSIFAMSFVVVVAITLIIFPDWIIPFAGSLRANLRVGQGLLFSETLQVWQPDDGKIIANITKWIALLLLFIEWRSARGKDFPRLLWVASLSIVMTPFLDIRITPDLFPYFFLPLVLFLKTIRSRWENAKWGIPFLFILLLSSWVIFTQSTHAFEILTFAFPFILGISLYWMRWWLIRPPRTWVDQIK